MRRVQRSAFQIHKVKPQHSRRSLLRKRLRDGVVWLMMQLLVLPPLALWHTNTYAADCDAAGTSP
jgi:hypothetical protein